jgi:hypothetical protein
LSMVSKAPRTLSATSAEPRASTQLESSMMAASSASWFSLILYSREGGGPNVASQIDAEREKLGLWREVNWV